ncbi:MAG: DNRLRE domain-containing protein, partial [Candidatus Aenigmarchaeota archaeon]|nr:DNRLRE domain-containing protein [Candidatus Aenigmarchaeota archaeon]
TATCGTGACFRSISQTCSAGSYTPACIPGSPTAETCNNVDDDCDGQTDEDGVCGGSSGAINITAAEDNLMDGTFGTDRTLNKGGYAFLSLGDKFGGDKPQRGLIKFDLSAIPAGSTITSATMELTCVSTNSGDTFTLSAYRLLKPWVEGAGPATGTANTASSWNYWNYPSDWGSPGASSASSSGSDNSGDGTGFDRLSTPVASTPVTGCSSTKYRWAITSAVQNWKSGSWQNNGLVIISSGEGSSSSGKHFASSEYTTASIRPKLVVTYQQ